MREGFVVEIGCKGNWGLVVVGVGVGMVVGY